MSVSEVKSNLARLLAEEDLIVEQRKVPTAYFDTENRLLVLPTFKDELSNDVQDMMISHEVGHALYTPNDEWFEAISNVKKSVINVVEDARIEKKIKLKYPGLRVIYNRAYKELLAMDFFGLSKYDISKLNLIDRINLHFKIGFFDGLDFNQEEQTFVEKVEKVQTFSDSVKVSEEIIAYMKEHKPEDPTIILELEHLEGFGENIHIEFDDSIEDENEEGTEEEPVEEQSGGSDSINSYGLQKGGDLKEGEEGKELESRTQENSENNAKWLYDTSNKQSFYVDIPEINLKDYIVDYSVIYKRFKSDISSYAININNYNDFKKENNSVISFLIKEFSLKKNAEARMKTKISKTGDINLNRIFAHKISEDIFKRSAITPKHKSHGLVFFLDWSSSMAGVMKDTIRQLLTMLMFCKKLNIPFEVYSFSSKYYDINDSVEKNPLTTAILNPVKLLNLFSSRMSNREFIQACNYMLSYNVYIFEGASPYDRQRTPNWFDLGNTPLNHTIILSQKVMEEFKEKTKVQIDNAIYLTDGESHQIRYNYSLNNNYTYTTEISSGLNKVYLRDKNRKTSMSIRGRNTYYVSENDLIKETEDCMNFIKQSSNFRMFGFRVIENVVFKRNLHQFFPFYEKVDKTKEFNKNNCIKLTNRGYDEFWLIKANSMNSSDEGELRSFGEKETAASIAKKFTKSVGGKVNNRIFLKKFIEFIS